MAEKSVVSDEELNNFDWRDRCIAVGARRLGNDQPWLGLTVTEMKVLEMLLTKKVSLVDKDGPFEFSAEQYPGLQVLARGLKSMALWHTEHPVARHSPGSGPAAEIVEVGVMRFGLKR